LKAKRLANRSGAWLDQLQHLGAATRQTTFTIERRQDQLCRTADVTLFCCCAGLKITILDSPLKLLIVCHHRHRIAGMLTQQR